VIFYNQPSYGRVVWLNPPPRQAVFVLRTGERLRGLVVREWDPQAPTDKEEVIVLSESAEERRQNLLRLVNEFGARRASLGRGSPGVAARGVVVPLFVFRTAFEDRTLRRELEGYQEYAQRSRTAWRRGCGRQVHVPRRLWALRSPGKRSSPSGPGFPKKGA
jgi:hypothetical protein